MRAVEASRERAARARRPRSPRLLQRLGAVRSSAPAVSPRPTSASARIASTSRRTSPSARGCSTTSGPACPIVCTDGDVFAGLVRREGLGAVVPPGDAAALARAIDRLLADAPARAAARTALARIGREMQWSRVVAPLARFLGQPQHAADRAVGVARVRADLEGAYRLSKWIKRTALTARRAGAPGRAAQAAEGRRDADDSAQPPHARAGATPSRLNLSTRQKPPLHRRNAQSHPCVAGARARAEAARSRASAGARRCHECGRSAAPA